MSLSTDDVTKIEYPTVQQTFKIAIFASLFMLATFSKPLITTASEISLYGVLFIQILLFWNLKRWLRKILLAIVGSVGLFLIIAPYNPIYLGLENSTVLNYSGQGVPFTFYDYGFYMFLLFIESIAAFGVTIWYYKRKAKKIEDAESEDALQPMFDYFLTKPNVRKILILSLMLAFASFYEEMIYRYFLVNILLAIGLPIIIVLVAAGFVFSLAHQGNVYMAYVFSSFCSGIIFSIVYINHGLGAAWIIHMTWNAMVVLQDYLTMWAMSNNASMASIFKRGKH